MSLGARQSHAGGGADPKPRRRLREAPRRWTALTVEALPLSAKGKRRYEADPNTPGLKLRISDQSKVWYAVAWSRRFERVIRVKLGVFPRLGLSAARSEAADVLDAIERGLDPNEERRREQAQAQAAAEIEAKVATGTFENVAASFVERPRNAKGKPGDRWREEQRRLLARPELDPWRSRPITEIARDDVKAVVAAVARKTPVEANRLLATLKRLFAWAIEEEILDSHPATAVKKVGQEETRERVLSDREISKVWKALDSIGHPFGGLAQFSLATACRRGEAAAMRWTDVDLEDRLWKLPRTKRGGGDEKPLSALALDLTRDRQARGAEGIGVRLPERSRGIPHRLRSRLRAGEGSHPRRARLASARSAENRRDRHGEARRRSHRDREDPQPHRSERDRDL